jgi:hypothetical protein
MPLLKRLKFHLQLWDGIWSIPLTMVSFIAMGVLIQHFFTNPGDPQGGPGFYDPSFLQAAFYASCMQVFVNTMVWFGVYFNWRHVWRYYKGKRKDDGTIENKSKNDFDNLTPWRRIVLLLSLYSFLSVEWIVLFLTLK